MYNPKVLSIFNDVEKQSNNICTEVDSFLNNIVEWADELGGIIEKEFTAGKKSGLFLLPKTPSEKKSGNRKARNVVVSKCSNINSTFLQNQTYNLDDTISTRTRGAKRAATSKMSQANVTIEAHSEETKENILAVKKNTKDESDATFVLSETNSKTKPVLRNKEQEATESKNPESQTSEFEVLNTSNEILEKCSSQKRVTKAGLSPPQHPSKHKVSSSSPGEQARTKAPTVIGETPVERLSRRKISRTLSQSPAEQQSVTKILRSLSGTPIVRSSSVANARSVSKSPIMRSSSLRQSRNTKSSATGFIDNSSKNYIPTNQNCKSSKPKTRSSFGNKTITIKKELTPIASSTFALLDETNHEDKTPLVKEGGFFRLSNTSTPEVNVDRTPVTNTEANFEMVEDAAKNSEPEDLAETNANVLTTVVAEEISENADIPKKKRKLKKDEDVKENIEEVAGTVRITRTKSKAIKKMMEENETKQADLSAFAKKLLNKAKMTSAKKNQLAALLECNSSTPTNGPRQLPSILPFGNLTTSKSKYYLLSSSKKLKTPISTVSTSGVKIEKASEDKNRSKLVKRDSSSESIVRAATKLPKDNLLEKEMKLKSKKEKEEEAALKRQNAIKNKQEKLKRKNELKHQMAMKQREKLEQEKYQNMIQSEREKEEKHKLILQERQMKLKEEAFKKKMLTQQKIAETVERRRMEEEARIAKLKEMEAEEQRLALEKQKEQERLEKRAQERLAEKKAREEYEMQLKQELEAERLKAGRLMSSKKCLPSASKVQSASKRQKFIIGEKRDWDYKPRNENDYGLDDEHSEVDSEDEKSNDKTKPAMPWAKKIMNGKSPVVKILTLEMLCEFMPCYQKSPDIHKMFKMTPSKRIKRTSSAIWNTPSS